MAKTDMNSVFLIGRLTRDAELSYFQSGSAVSKFSIAVNRSRKDGEQWISEANFFDVSLFGKSAENLKKYLLKGTQVAVQGSLRQDRWEKDGQKFSRVYVVANDVQLLGGRSDSNGEFGGYTQNSSGYQGNGGYSPRQGQAPSYGGPDTDGFGGDSGDFPEDIPF